MVSELIGDFLFYFYFLDFQNKSVKTKQKQRNVIFNKNEKHTNY